ncbi:asparagine synthase (glutamine-hydrolyzing) [Chitiniphilus purpureus]|uniref:asparagine synthase (glutamine-hydrolyzing) n=1 Tax=Chitiniphilus purpureus TaxID=2981137 RepID=A0ABY6DMN1_9NEIS|nr:asparagine synthase (glutamine-hydrolyzing) [Chitiniphilus sp. CD1]UXY15612.1 asparagine synthase (glutamine-hydrolyzing) [Chitiniphilus sp. CD1]
MCGIFGMIGHSAFPGQIHNICTQSMHRGPDGQGSWQNDDPVFPVWLGHTRLAIIDLSDAGQQPMTSPDGRWILTFNGEIFNYLELRAELQQAGVQFTTQTDTEVLLQGLMHEGPAFQLRCNGMWAFCLYDRQSRVALLGRDRFGEKPIFWCNFGKGIAFASEMKALYPLLNVPEPSQHTQGEILDFFSYEFLETTAVQGLFKIPPGHYATFGDGQEFSLCRWWCTLDHLPEIPSNYPEQVAAFRELFLDAVRIRMRADVRMGTALSGGLDSTSTFCSMAWLAQQELVGEKSSPDWQHAICASYPGSAIDEAAWAEQAAQYTGSRLTVLNIDPVHSGWNIEDALYSSEDPYLTLPLPHLATYRALSEAGIKVSLDGHGADELFCGYGHWIHALDNASWQESLELEAMGRALTGKPYRLSGWRTARLLANRRGLAPLLDRYRHWCGRNVPNPDRQHSQFIKMDQLSRRLYELFHFTILPTLLRNYDRYSMASGVEIRMPFLDYRLVCFVFALPWTAKVGGGFTKRILRDAMQNIIPDKIRLRRDKIGWNAPVGDWLRGPLQPEIQSLLDSTGDSSARHNFAQFCASAKTDYQSGEKAWKLLAPVLWRQMLSQVGKRHTHG